MADDTTRDVQTIPLRRRKNSIIATPEEVAARMDAIATTTPTEDPTPAAVEAEGYDLADMARQISELHAMMTGVLQAIEQVTPMLKNSPLAGMLGL